EHGNAARVIESIADVKRRDSVGGLSIAAWTRREKDVRKEIFDSLAERHRWRSRASHLVDESHAQLESRRRRDVDLVTDELRPGKILRATEIRDHEGRARRTEPPQDRRKCE